MGHCSSIFEIRIDTNTPPSPNPSPPLSFCLSLPSPFPYLSLPKDAATTSKAIGGEGALRCGNRDIGEAQKNLRQTHTMTAPCNAVQPRFTANKTLCLTLWDVQLTRTSVQMMGPARWVDKCRPIFSSKNGVAAVPRVGRKGEGKGRWERTA